MLFDSFDPPGNGSSEIESSTPCSGSVPPWFTPSVSSERPEGPNNDISKVQWLRDYPEIMKRSFLAMGICFGVRLTWVWVS